MKKSLKLLILLVLCLAVINNQEAQAYINPGSGSYIFQTIIGGILGIFYLFKKMFLAVIGIVTPNKNHMRDDTQSDD